MRENTLNNMESISNEIIRQIEKCILHKLTKTLEESQEHREFDTRLKNLSNNFYHLLNSLGEIDLTIETTVLAFLKILYEELSSVGPWNNELSKIYGVKLNSSFDLLCGFSLKKLFYSDTIDSQTVFETCIKVLNEKITVDNFKHYPSLGEVYCVLVQNVNEYNLSVDAPKVLPISLYLIDDYMNSNRIKGLNCLHAVLKCLKPEAFAEGNYYEVIFRSLKNKFSEKDIEVTRLLINCILILLKILPHNVKSLKTHAVLSMILEQTYIESNLYRKALLLKFMKDIIEIHGVNCVKRKKLKLIFCDNLDMCCNDAVAEVLLSDVLECFETWIKHCWCVWRISSDQKLLRLLIKLLYVTKHEPWISKIRFLTITLIKLSPKNEQQEILRNLDTSEFRNLQFTESLESIKTQIGKQIEIVY